MVDRNCSRSTSELPYIHAELEDAYITRVFVSGMLDRNSEQSQVYI
jgi:hypothetical protein